VQTIGSGDWIAPIARLTGTHTGSLPAFLASAPFPATGKGFDVLHDTIAADGWQEFWSHPESRAFAELLIDCEEDRTLRAVPVGMLREAD
jgi:hypothetical protein